jgi:hypothetical protein
MKKLLILIVAGVFLLSAGFVWAQDESMTDDEFVNVTAPKKQDMDVYLGFRLGLTKDTGNDGALQVSPGIALGYNYWLQPITETLSIGPVIRASVGFVNEVEVPLYYPSDLQAGRLNQIPGRSDIIKWGDNAILMNIDALAGYGLKYQFSDLFGLVAKGGLAFNADVAVGSYDMYDYVYGWVTKEITTGSMIAGLGVDVGLQFQPSKTLPLYMELGMGFSFDFMGMLFTTLDYTQNGKSVLPNEKALTDTGNFEPQGFLSIGAPYLVFGWRL